MRPKYSFKGNSCKNARIRIDYSGIKPKVTFSYPSKLYGIQGSMLFWIIIGWFVIYGMVLFIHDIVYKTDLDITTPLMPLISFVCLVVPPAVFYFPFKKFWNNVYPKWQGFLAQKKIKTFNPNEVEHNEKFGYYCEVPIFNNIIFNYEATKDFSRFLDFFEIEEHKFKYYLKKPKKKLSKMAKKRRRRESFNEFLWYARFYFKDKPNKGKLEVMFK